MAWPTTAGICAVRRKTAIVIYLTGPAITLCAPSSGSPGRCIVTTDRRGNKGYSSGDYTYSFGGTSSSTPLAAGLVGLILSVDSGLTSTEVRRIMMDTADKRDLDNGTYVDGHSPQYGHGRINAHAALVLVSGGGHQSLPEVLYMEHRINRPIPDQGEVEDVIPFPLEVDVETIEVSLNIRHTWRGDLRIVLTSPQGNEVVLLDKSGGDRDDVILTLRSSDEPEMFEELAGLSAQGDWRLKVSDLAKEDVGIIKKWGLSITYK